jgi:hypothetical protein
VDLTAGAGLEYIPPAMNTTIPLILCVLTVAGGDGRGAREPARPASGKVLVLDNDRTLEGEIEKVGDRYRVRRSLGVTWVPGERVLRLCDSQRDALAFLRRRANLDDPDERLRLARWCHLQGLREEALKEVKAAVALRPDHGESRRLLQYLEESARAAAEAPKQPAPPAPEKRAALPPVDLSAEAMSLFASRVQPILMNACARCHIANTGETFRLQRTYGVGASNRRAMQHNLAAVLAQLNLRQPELSPLLVKAVSAHGPTGEAPLKGRQAEAFRTLEDWVRRTLSHNPQLRDHSSPPPSLMRAVDDAPPQPFASTAPRPAGPGTPPAAKTAPARDGVPIVPAPTPPGPASTRPATKSPRPAGAGTPPPASPPAEPVDEFDPSIFNRQMHPDRKP